MMKFIKILAQNTCHMYQTDHLVVMKLSVVSEINDFNNEISQEVESNKTARDF